MLMCFMGLALIIVLALVWVFRKRPAREVGFRIGPVLPRKEE
jgi:hypothetical protein